MGEQPAGERRARSRLLDRRTILEALFTSRTRVSLLEVLLGDPQRGFYSRELERLTGEHQNAIWRELRHMEQMGLLTSELQGRVRRYRARAAFPLLEELRALVWPGSRPAGLRPRESDEPYRPELVVGETD